MTKDDRKTLEKRFDKSLKETFRILTRTERLGRLLSKALKTNHVMRKTNRKLIRKDPKDKLLQREKTMLELDERSLRLQELTVMNVEMALVYLLDFSLLLHERSSGITKDVAKLQRVGRQVVVQTPKRYYKVLETLRREIELNKKHLEISQRTIGRYIH